jgi:hypothetical protein
MAINIPPNLTSGNIRRDFEAIWADLRRMIPQVAPEWTYYEDDDVGAALLQFAAYLADHAHYRADAVMRDAVPTRSPFRETVREFAEWLGYLARRPTAAEVDVTFSIETALADDLSIPVGTRVSGTGPSGSVTFETTDEVILPAGATSVGAHVAQGTTRSGALLGYATGSSFEKFAIPDADCLFNWLDEEIVVTVDGAEANHYRWPALLTSDVLGFWVRQNGSGLLEIRFGDGTFGRSLPPGAEVRATYRRGGGSVGNVGAGAVDTVLSSVEDAEGTPVTLTVTNDSMAAPGLPEETLASIRGNAPAFFRSQNRAVTVNDYAVLAMMVTGVFKARIVTSGVNGVRIAIVPTGLSTGVRVTDTLKARVVRALDPVKMATDVVSAEAARLIPVDVELVVRAHPGKRNGVVREAIRQRFISDEGIFAEEVNDLGRTLWFSDMVGSIEAVDGVNNFDVVRYCRRPVLTWDTYLGDAGLSSSGVTTNATTQAQTWTITMVNSTEFIVEGSVSGAQENTGTLGAVYSDDAGEISFTIDAGLVDLAENDSGTIVVGKLVGNIEIAQDEFPIFDSKSTRIRVSGGIGA